MSVSETIEKKLKEALTPTILKVIDDSARHAGHAGAKPEGETHFKVILVTEAFDGLNQVARQRRVYEILATEMAGPIHALEMTTQTPSEYKS